MRQITLGGKLKVSPLCLGLGDFGSRINGSEASHFLETFIQAGGNFVDTAHCYCAWLPNGEGLSERTLGAALRDLGCRYCLNIATKGGHCAFESYPRPDLYMSPDIVSNDIEDSLDRLGIEFIDLYFLHRDDPRVPVDEIMSGLNEQIEEGKIKTIGASNWSVERLAAANDWATSKGLQPFCISQVHWSLAKPTWAIDADPTMRYMDAEMLAWHQNSNLPVAAYSPSAGGFFARTANGEATYGTPENLEIREKVLKEAERLQCTPTQVVLAWLRQHAFKVIPIIGTMNPEHLEEAFGALEIQETISDVVTL